MPLCSTNASISGRREAERAPGRARRRARPGPSSASRRRARSWPISASTRVVLPEPFGPTSATRSPHASSTSSGPRTKPPRRSVRAVEPHRDVARALPAAEAQLQLPALPRLVDDLEPFERLLGRADLRRLLLGALRAVAHDGLVGIGALGLLDARLRPLALAADAADEPVALRGEGLEPLLVVARGGRAQLLVAGPAAAVLGRGVGDLVDLQHPRDRAGEEGAIVGDDHRAAGALGDEALEPVQAVEVEVVGRLVEQQHVEAREQDRGQRGAGGLAAGQRRGLEVEQAGVEPEVAQHGLRAGVEVGAAERQPALERLGVAVAAPVGVGQSSSRPRRGVAPRRRRCAARGSRAASRRARGRAPAADSRRLAAVSRTLPRSGASTPAAAAAASTCRRRWGRRRRARRPARR